MTKDEAIDWALDSLRIDNDFDLGVLSANDRAAVHAHLEQMKDKLHSTFKWNQRMLGIKIANRKNPQQQGKLLDLCLIAWRASERL